MQTFQEARRTSSPPFHPPYPRPHERPPRGSLVGWWFRLTAPPGAREYSTAPTHHERERLRRAGLASIVAPILSLSTLLLVQQAGDPGTRLAMLLCVTCPLVALVLFNRRGHPVMAALLIAGCMEVAIEVALLTTIKGGLSAAWLPTFDLFLLPLIAVGVLLSRQYLFLAALIHIGIILGDFFLLPHAPDLTTMIVAWHGPLVALARPILAQIVGGTMSFVEVRSTDDAIARADRAEEVAILQRAIAHEQQRIAEEKGRIEVTAVHLRDAMVGIANGQEQVEVPIEPGSILWDVGRGLHLMTQRLKRATMREREWVRTNDAAHALQLAMERCAKGEFAVWPKASGTAVDPLIELGRCFAVRAYDAERGIVREEPPEVASSPSTPGTVPPRKETSERRSW